MKKVFDISASNEAPPISCENSTSCPLLSEREPVVSIVTNLSPVSNGTSARHRIHKESVSLHCLTTPNSLQFEEFTPNIGSYIDEGTEGEKDGWKWPLGVFSSLKHGRRASDSKLPKRVRRFYKKQDEIIDQFEQAELGSAAQVERKENQLLLQRRAQLLAKVTLLVNVVLIIVKVVATVISGSLSVISSLVDSAVDILSGLIIWLASRYMKKHDPYVYPEGKTRMEPIAIVILSVVMSLASVQLIIQSVQVILSLANGEERPLRMDAVTITLIAFTIVAKFVLFMVSRRYQEDPSIRALTIDHMNDVLSNAVALTCGFLGEKLWPYADPIGAILISIYIGISWWITGWTHMKHLTGVTAGPEFVQKLTWICVNHHEKIQLIDTVRAFHFGNNFLVEVHVVLPSDLTLKEAHDIGEPLQNKLEMLPEVERAFVHIDYESDHRPSSEHKPI